MYEDPVCYNRSISSSPGKRGASSVGARESVIYLPERASSVDY